MPPEGEAGGGAEQHTLGEKVVHKWSNLQERCALTFFFTSNDFLVREFFFEKQENNTP